MFISSCLFPIVLEMTSGSNAEGKLAEDSALSIASLTRKYSQAPSMARSILKSRWIMYYIALAKLTCSSHQRGLSASRWLTASWEQQFCRTRQLLSDPNLNSPVRTASAVRCSFSHRRWYRDGRSHCRTRTSWNGSYARRTEYCTWKCL